MEAYKAFTHDLCSPIQGGDPVWDGALPHVLPTVDVDTSDRECGAGWNACCRPEDALRIARLWPDGCPIRLFRVETDADIIERGDKLRAATWTVTEEVDVAPAIEALSQRWFGDHAAAMAREQIAWHRALGRPLHDADAVERGLRLALRARGLDDWTLRRFDSARAARAARAAWATCAAWDAWAVWAARAAWAAAWAAWDAMDARADAWDAMDARNAWDARAWDARAALVVYYAATMGWVDHPRTLLTRGIRTAYRHGLAVAVPTGARELGWALVER